MLRSLTSKTLTRAVSQVLRTTTAVTVRPYSDVSEHIKPTKREFGAKVGIGRDEDMMEPTMEYSKNLISFVGDNRCSGYEIRDIVTELQAMDYIPESDVIKALMKACRRVNDYALAVRILESVKFKCGKDNDLFGKLIKPIQGTLDDLGILTPKEMGYDKPEFYWPDVFDIDEYDPVTKKPVYK